MNTKVLLLLFAVVVCMAVAQRPVSQRCLCRRVRDRFGRPSRIEDIQIITPSPSCDKLEIIVRLKDGVFYCLDPKIKNVEILLSKYMKESKPLPTPSPTVM